MINWLPRGRQAANDPAPPIEELKNLTEYSDRRIRAIGLERGFLLGGKHVVPVGNNDRQPLVARLLVYPKKEKQRRRIKAKDCYYVNQYFQLFMSSICHTA